MDCDMDQYVFVIVFVIAAEDSCSFAYRRSLLLCGRGSASTSAAYSRKVLRATRCWLVFIFCWPSICGVLACTLLLCTMVACKVRVPTPVPPMKKSRCHRMSLMWSRFRRAA